MKHTLIATLVASALEILASSAGAQTFGQCDLVGNASLANAATPVRTGPMNPTNGFPEYVTDSTGVSVQRCLDPVFCFASPVIPTDPFSIQIGSGGESFYWGASTVVNDPAGNRVLTYVAAAEAAFLSLGANGEPIQGSQFAFLRLRFTMGVPVDGVYTVVHPYGTNTFNVTGATGARDVFFTIDKGLASSADVQGAVGPFMTADPAFSIVPVGFLGDGGVAAAPVPALGSPCGRNFVQVTGVDTAGNPVDFGGSTALVSDLFTIQGQNYDGRVQTPLNAPRLTYTRTLAGGGQIDSFGSSTAAATMEVIDGPTIATGTGRIATAVTLDHTQVDPTLGLNSTSVTVRDASAVPALLALTASDAVSVNATTGLPAFDPTTLILPLVDFVDIASAEYDPASGVLTVTASSGDARLAPLLTLRDFGAFTPGQPTKLVTTVAPPTTVHVDSAAGGTATAQVHIVSQGAPIAPSGLSVVSATSHTLTLSWADNSSNESGFKIYSVAAGGARTLLATVAANATGATLTGLATATAYVLQVDAFNATGFASSTTQAASTLALPLAPTSVAAALSTTQTRAINLSWVDNSTDETSFQVLRATALAGPYSQVASVAASTGTGVRSIVDLSGPPATATTYFYQVLAVRGPDSSDVAQSTGLLTPAAAASALAVTPVAISATQVNISWTDRATNETGYQVYRRTGTTGTFTAVSAVLPANSTSFSDTTVATGTQYFYRVDVSNWAGAVPSAVSIGVTPGIAATLLAPTALAASTANQPVLTWVDQSTGETNYRVRRTPLTVGADGRVGAGPVAVVSATVAANATSFTDPTRQTNGATLQYDVAATTAVSTGPVATVATVIGGLPTANRPTLVRTAATARVTVSWSAPGTTTSIGGYEIQRCTGTNCTTFTKVAGTALNTAGTVDGRATVSFIDNSVARNTAYTYRMRVVGGAGTGLTGAFSPTQTVATN